MGGLSGLKYTGLSGLVGASGGGVGGPITSPDLLHLWAVEPLVSGFSGPVIRGIRVDNSNEFDANSLDEFDAAISGTTGLIDRLYDQKGNNHLVCRNTARRPGYGRTTVYGKDALDQSTDALAREGFASSVIGGFPITLYTVVQDYRGDNNNRNSCFLFAASSVDYAGFASAQTTDLTNSFLYDGGSNGVPGVATNPALFTMTINSSTNASLVVNGGAVNSNSIQSVGSPVYFQFNAWNGWNPLGWCKFACIAISAGRSTQIETELKSYYGIA